MNDISGTLATINARLGWLVANTACDPDIRQRRLPNQWVLPPPNLGDGPAGHPPICFKFVHYNGEGDHVIWLCKCEQYFDIYGTLDRYKLFLAAYHLDEEAQLWFQLLKKDRPVSPSWMEFWEDIMARYGSSKLEDFFEDLAKLRQTTYVDEYYKTFIRLVTKAGNVTNDQHVSFFVIGL